MRNILLFLAVAATVITFSCQKDLLSDVPVAGAATAAERGGGHHWGDSLGHHCNSLHNDSIGGHHHDSLGGHHHGHGPLDSLWHLDTTHTHHPHDSTWTPPTNPDSTGGGHHGGHGHGGGHGGHGGGH